MEKLIINGFAFFDVIEKKGSVRNWVLIPTLEEKLRRCYQVSST
ncbi:MAG: hypothetical protein ABIK99_01330 [candidate division WOR-3 bacterium]